MNTAKRIVELGEELSDACVYARPAVRAIRAAVHMMTGDTRMNVLGIAQYAIIMLRIVGLDFDEAMTTCAHCVSRAYEVGEPFLDDVYKAEREYTN